MKGDKTLCPYCKVWVGQENGARCDCGRTIFGPVGGGWDPPLGWHIFGGDSGE